jgi:hypothetical protein
MALTIKSFADLFSGKPAKTKSSATGRTKTFDGNSQTGILSVPSYQEHLSDIFTSRHASNSQDLMSELFKQDPDVSAAVSGYLTLANTDLVVYVEDPKTGAIDREASKTLGALIHALTEPWDYTKGFQLKPDLATLSEEMRYMALLRGGVGSELVFDKQMTPDRIENVDLYGVEWKEKESGVYKPFQRDKATNAEISLDIPTFFVAFHRRDPTKIYQHSDFVSAINSIAARQLVINELYSIMKMTGYSRLSVGVVEEVVTRSAPAAIKADPAKLRTYLNSRLSDITNMLIGLKSGQPFVHWDSAKPEILNDKNPGASMDIQPVINVLNAQNQAALKTMPTVLGRGSNATAASVEARYAAMCADELNKPVAMNQRRAFQLLLNINGIPGIVRCRYLPAELRPHDELEPQRVMKAARLKDDLSLGLITDEEYHMAMFNRPARDGAPTLSGTGFMQGGPEADTSKISPNGDPMGQAITPEGAKSAKSNEVKKSGGSKVVAGYEGVELARQLIASHIASKSA